MPNKVFSKSNVSSLEKCTMKNCDKIIQQHKVAETPLKEEGKRLVAMFLEKKISGDTFAKKSQALHAQVKALPTYKKRDACLNKHCSKEADELMLNMVKAFQGIKSSKSSKSAAKTSTKPKPKPKSKPTKK